MELLALGERFDAQEALRLGIVNRVVPRESLAAATQSWVDTILAGPHAALTGMKRLLQRSSTSTLSEQLQAEALSFGQCTATPDFVEGIEAFLAKRPPRFGGPRNGQD